MAATPPAPGVVHLGTDVAVPARQAANAPAVAVTPGGDVTLNFTDADVREVVKAVVGDILGLNYSIDAKVQGTVTVQTMKPLPREAVLPTLQRVLRANGMGLVQDNGFVRVMPLDNAKGAAPGYGLRVVPLRFVSADQLDKVIAPFVPTGATIEADPTHNFVLLSGTPEDMDSLAALIASFDVDWISRMSFALVPLGSGTAEAIVNELQAIINGAASGAPGAADAVRLLPIERLNAVLVISASPRYLDWARQQIATLDQASLDGAERTYIYHVQYGRASDLSDVLGRVYGVETATPKSTNQNQSYLNSQSFGTSALTSSPSSGGGLTSGTTGMTPSTGGLAAGLGSTSGQSQSPGSSLTGPLSNVLSQAQGNGVTPPTAGSTSPAGGTSSGQGQNAPPVRIVTDERNNAIVIVTSPREYRRVEETLKHLDVRPLQVVIEATIAEVTLNDELQFGLQWFFRQNGTNSVAFTNNSTATPAQVFPGFSYLLSEAKAQIVLNALATITTVNVVSSPQLLVLNNQTAELQVGQQVPVPVQQQQSVTTPEAPLVNTISYLNTGVILSVTPRANATGEVTLDIEQEVSDVATETTSGLNAPTINERRVKSTVSVESGDSVALGGLISNSVTKNRSAVPFLGDIPVLGQFFRNDDNTTARTELLVLIEPRIINGTDEARAATDDLEHRMHEITPIELTHP